MITNLCAIDSRKCKGCSGSKRSCPAYYQKIEGEFGSYLLMGDTKFLNNPRVKLRYSKEDLTNLKGGV